MIALRLFSISVASAALAGLACNARRPAEPPQATAQLEPLVATSPSSPLSLGAPLPAERGADVDIALALADPERYGESAVTVQGVVTAVCQR